MLKDWIEIWGIEYPDSGVRYLLINVNNISVIKSFEGKSYIIMNNGDAYTVEASTTEVYNKIYDARRKGI